MTPTEQAVLNFPEVRAKLWLGDYDKPAEVPPIFTSETAFVAAERTDGDEVAVHVTLQGDDNALVSVYMPRVQAIALARAIDGEATREFS